jgi:proline racemase
MITVKQTKEIRELLGLSHIVIFGVTSDNNNLVSTHGKTVNQAKEAAHYGNVIKKALGWPLQLCKSEPLERICRNCDYYQWYKPQFENQNALAGSCMYQPNPIDRKPKDRACSNFEPKI